MTKEQNIINDIGTNLHIQNKILDMLVANANLCIGSAIHDAIIEKKQAIILDIGIGELCINIEDMQCKFIPSKELKAIIKKSIVNKIDPLIGSLEKTLVQKLVNIYKEEIE